MFLQMFLFFGDFRLDVLINCFLIKNGVIYNKLENVNGEQSYCKNIRTPSIILLDCTCIVLRSICWVTNYDVHYYANQFVFFQVFAHQPVENMETYPWLTHRFQWEWASFDCSTQWPSLSSLRNYGWVFPSLNKKKKQIVNQWFCHWTTIWANHALGIITNYIKKNSIIMRFQIYMKRSYICGSF